MNGIVSIRSKTSRLLSSALDVPVFMPNGTVPPLSTAIRWGSRRPIEANRVLNKAWAITQSSNKAACRYLLRQSGIPVPVETETDFPVVGRPEYHTQGKGFFICNSPKEVKMAKKKGAAYFSQFYPKQNEYRVHVGGDRVLLVSIKEGDKSRKVWNKRGGFVFRHMHRHEWLENEQLLEMTKAAKKAIKVMGLDFGAVDMMSDAPEPYMPFVVCEINTAPSLSPLAVSHYVRYFREHI